jgi:penicillin-binding protein 1A
MLEGRGTSAPHVVYQLLPFDCRPKPALNDEDRGSWAFPATSWPVATSFDTPHPMGRGASVGGFVRLCSKRSWARPLQKYGGGAFAVPDECMFINVIAFPAPAFGRGVGRQCCAQNVPYWRRADLWHPDGGFAMADLLFDEAPRAVKSCLTSDVLAKSIQRHFGSLSSGELY